MTNIFGQTLTVCSNDPATGYHRSGYCGSVEGDAGSHVICAEMTDEFLNFTKSKGNNLISPSSNFPGLKSGDHWCLCALRWKEAHESGKAPPVILEATDVSALNFVKTSDLKRPTS